MTVEIVSASFPTVPPASKREAFNAQKRIEQLEQWARSLSSQLSSYSYVPSEYGETSITSLDDITDGTTYVKVKALDVVGGRITITNTAVDSGAWGGTVGGVSAANVGTGATRAINGLSSSNRVAQVIYGTDLPSQPNISSAGLYMSADNIGYYSLVKKIQGVITGTFNVGETCTQAVSLATGVVVDYYNGSSTDDLFINVINGTFNATSNVTGDISGASCTSTAAVSNVYKATMLISNQGSFYFGGTGTNYISWDGAKINIVCTGGKIGSATNYYDITNGALRVSASASKYVSAETGTVSVYNVDPNDSSLVLYGFSATGSNFSNLDFKRSHSNTIGTLATTQANEVIGDINFWGVTSDNTWTKAVELYVYQQNAATATATYAQLDFKIAGSAVFGLYNRGSTNADKMVLTPYDFTANTVRVEGDRFASAAANTVLFTNVLTTSLSTGLNTILSDDVTGAHPNAGYIKIYLGTTAAYIPYWTTI
mgnify:CR=1 FL=1